MALSIDVAKIVQDAGGKVVGRTRLQKLAFLLEVSGLGPGFPFQYRRFGPYSQELATATRDATLLGFMTEVETQTPWGSTVSIFSTAPAPTSGVPPFRKDLAHAAAKADSIELELAATALFLHLQGEKAPWQETAQRKPEKASGGRLDRARALYESFRDIHPPNLLPALDQRI